MQNLQGEYTLHMSIHGKPSPRIIITINDLANITLAAPKFEIPVLLTDIHWCNITMLSKPEKKSFCLYYAEIDHFIVYSKKSRQKKDPVQEYNQKG